MNYYLPTTQKLLDSYAEFEAAGVEGENLRQAKGRIEAAMDSIVRGFTHQLDELYQADAMDVDSDLRGDGEHAAPGHCHSCPGLWPGSKIRTAVSQRK